MLREILSQNAGISINRIRRIQDSASKMYKTYPIPKRDGTDRIISQPTPELKAIQRWLVRVIFSRLPVSIHATAYKNGASIRYNALAHQGTLFTLHMDFKDFFPSFSIDKVKLLLSENTKLTKEDIDFCASIVCRYGRLTIGAPSSPSVTNALMYSFDSRLGEWCELKGLIYTRYADDINISSMVSNSLGAADAFIREEASAFRYGKLEINEAKTAYLSRKYKRSVTGIILTPDGNISIGRKRKREIKSYIHRYKEGKLHEDIVSRVSGLLAFASDVEPDFFRALENKYGESTINQIMRASFQQSSKL